MKDSEKYFLAVVREKSITKAAKELYISQQALSKHINRMEREYGVRLFDRTPRFQLTAAGEALAGALTQIRMIENNLQEILLEQKEFGDACLRLGMSRARISFVLPIILKRYHAIYPKVDFRCEHDKIPRLAEMAARGELDFFLALDGVHTKNLVTYGLTEERMFMVVSRKLLEEYSPRIYESYAAGEPFDAQFSDFGSMPFVLNSEQRAIIQQSIPPELQPKNILLQVDDPVARLNMCLTNFCGTTLFEMTCRNLLQETPLLTGNLCYFPVCESTIRARMVLAHPRKDYFPNYQRDFINLVTEVFQDKSIAQVFAPDASDA